jgi:hypothetical protein
MSEEQKYLTLGFLLILWTLIHLRREVLMSKKNLDNIQSSMIHDTSLADKVNTIEDFPKNERGELLIPAERIIPPPHQWIMIDLKGNWLGLRVEPEDKVRSEAFKDAISKEDRWYNRQERKWMFRTQYGALLFELMKSLCPDHVLILEEGNAQIIRSILVGPSLFALQKDQKDQKLPQGYIVGKIGNLEDWSK